MDKNPQDFTAVNKILERVVSLMVDEWGGDHISSIGYHKLARTLYREGLLAIDSPHVIDFSDANSWVLQHPLSCRPNLFLCPMNAAIDMLDETHLIAGKWVCSMDINGKIVFEREATSADLAR